MYRDTLMFSVFVLSSEDFIVWFIGDTLMFSVFVLYSEDFIVWFIKNKLCQNLNI